jgi:hypothetical protein
MPIEIRPIRRYIRLRDKMAESEFYDQSAGWEVQKSVTEELPDGVPLEVAQRANEIFFIMYRKIRRGTIRNQMLFYSTYCAYRELDYMVNPDSVGAMFKLSRKEVAECASRFSAAKTGYSPSFGKLSALNYLPGYCRSCGLTEDAFVEITEYYKQILEKDPKILEYTPNTLAAGLMMFYLSVSGLELDDKNKLSSVAGRSLATIKAMKDKIFEIHNS